MLDTVCKNIFISYAPLKQVTVKALNRQTVTVGNTNTHSDSLAAGEVKSGECRQALQ